MKGAGFVRTLLVALALGFIAIIPGRSAILNSDQGPTDSPTDNIATDDPTGSDGPIAPGDVVRSNAPGANDALQCTRSKNGGSTDVGVTANTIRLASTVVQSGPGSSFLSASPYGMQAIVRKVNAAGGICGRTLTLQLVDDAWDSQSGLRFIKTFINDKVFALPVVPSSEGLTAAIEAGEITRAKIPVVGTDGMLRQQYQNPWVFPVATATESTMRIMARYGYEKKKARCFGIVYDTRYRFGREGADAYRKYVKSLPGAKMCSDVGIYPARASYSSEIQRFNSACDSRCDFVAWLLEPQTALTWVAGRPQMGTKVTSGAQTLFNEQFAANCGKACAGMLVWTGYNPPIGNLSGLEDVGEYQNDVKTVSPTADTTNQFLEGSYLGMKIFVEALRRVGPNLTRARLRDELNRGCYTTQLSSKLCWTASDRSANKTAQAFSIVVAQGSFAGFKNERTGWVRDPSL